MLKKFQIFNFKFLIHTNWKLDIGNWILEIPHHSGVGQSLVELLITIGLAAILMPAFFIGFSATRGGRAQQDQRIQAIAYAREAEEALRVIRDNGWSNLTNGTYYPVQSGTTWVLHAGSETISGTSLTESITIADALRDSSTHQISPSGVDDPSTKAITITVTWSQPVANSSITQVVYFTRHTNISFLDSTVSNFTAGTTNGTTITNIIDGEVELGGGNAAGDWCKPQNASVVKYNLPGQAYATAISAVVGHAYVTTGGNSSGDSMDGVNINDPPAPSPPVVTSGGVYNNRKTYGVFADASHTYLTSDHPGLTVDIVQTTSSPYSESGTFSDSGGEAGTSIYAANTTSGGYTGFVTAGAKLYAFNLNSQTGSRSQDGNAIALSGTGNKVIVVGNYAYVATASTTNQLQIINISNPSSMSLTKSFSVGNNHGATDVYVDSSGKYAFLVTSFVDSSTSDVFIIDVSNPGSPSIVGSANTYQNNVGMSPTGVIAVSGNHLVVVGSGGQEYQVFYTYPVFKYCGGTSPSGITKINAVAGISEADGDNFAYILTDDSSNEFQIVPGGEGGGASSQGTFISEGIPTSALTANATFNNFFPIADVPSPTTIAYQVGVAPTCASTFTFVGPDGTTNTTFATASAIPFTGSAGYQNPGECFKYKVFMNANGSSILTPILYQVNVNYSP